MNNINKNYNVGDKVYYVDFNANWVHGYKYYNIVEAEIILINNEKIYDNKDIKQIVIKHKKYPTINNIFTLTTNEYISTNKKDINKIIKTQFINKELSKTITKYKEQEKILADIKKYIILKEEYLKKFN